MTENQISELIKAGIRAEMARIRKRRLIMVAVGIFLAPFVIWAATITKPHTFTSGTPAVASEINANFDTLFTKVNELDAKIERRLGVFCGKTAATYDGAQVGGYTGAKNKCETACSNANAHMCSNTELTISSQLNISIGASSVWLNMGFNQRGLNYRDCEGWTSNNGAQYGSVWSSTVANDAACNVNSAIACCL